MYSALNVTYNKCKHSSNQSTIIFRWRLTQSGGRGIPRRLKIRSYVQYRGGLANTGGPLFETVDPGPDAYS